MCGGLRSATASCMPLPIRRLYVRIRRGYSECAAFSCSDPTPVPSMMGICFSRFHPTILPILPIPDSCFLIFPTHRQMRIIQIPYSLLHPCRASVGWRLRQWRIPPYSGEISYRRRGRSCSDIQKTV